MLKQNKKNQKKFFCLLIPAETNIRSPNIVANAAAKAAAIEPTL
jgi:hypothetical protein